LQSAHRARGLVFPIVVMSNASTVTWRKLKTAQRT
jgi:hypothetical protein